MPPIRLYELVIDNGLSMSPFVWRTRYALAHKGLPVECVPLGFTEIAPRFAGRHKTVPVIEDGGELVCDSWVIADHLDRAYPDRRPLFAAPGERAMVRFFDAWFSGEILRRCFGIYALDIHDAARPADRPYFRKSREARVGLTLEEFVAGREERVGAVREALGPLRRHLGDGPFIGGDAPNYADYIALGGLLWIAGVATVPLLAHDDALLAWWQRGLDLYDGLARDARLRPLAG